jgi:hypothetical protein
MRYPGRFAPRITATTPSASTQISTSMFLSMQTR